MRAVSYLSVVQDLLDIAGDRSFKHVYICFRRRLSPVWRDRCGDGEVRRTLQRNMPALLELFKGTGSIGRAFEARGWEVVSLDILPKFTPTICCDILRWDYRAAFPPGRFDCVWASPVCTEYSQALMVLRAIEIIAYLAPRLWAIKNPQTGLLKTRPFMQHLGFVDAHTACTVHPLRSRHASGRTCAGRPAADSAGPATAARPGRTAGTHAPHKGVFGKSARYENVCRQSRELLYSIPAALCDENAAAAEASET